MKQLLLLALLLPLSVAAQVTYYVDAATGNDANVGTGRAAPWRTLQKACDAATPNSTVLVRGGTYYENLVVRVSGAAAQPITFQAYGTEVVRVDGTGTAGTTLLRVANGSFLRFENLVFQNLTAANAQGILVETTGTGTATDLTFKNVTVRNIRWTNNAAAVPRATDNAQGFIAYGRQGGITRLTLDSCEVSDNVLGFSEALTMDGNVDGFAVRRCRVHDNTNIGIALIGHYGVSPDPATDQARHGLVQGNSCYRNVSAYATSGGLYVDGARDIVVDGNRSYENGWGIEVGAEENGDVTNIEVTNNLLYRNQQAGLALGGYTTATTGQVLGCAVRNNTFLFNNTLNDGTGELVLTKASNCRFENNAVYTTAQNVLFSVEAIAPQAGNGFDYNTWYTPANNAGALAVNWRNTTYPSFAAYQTGTGQDGNSRYADPGLANAALAAPDAHLRATSPCRAAGNPATATRPGETDFDGQPRVVGPRLDIGAFAFGSTATGTPPGRATAPALSLFPVPTPDIVQVQVPFVTYSLALYDDRGQLVRRLPASPAAFSVRELPAGVYWIRVTAPTGQTLTRRLVKE